MNIQYTYSLEELCPPISKYWINYFIKKGANNWNYILSVACQGGHLDLVNMMIQKGANVNWGLAGACKGGHLDLVNMMIQKGANPMSEYKIPFKIPKDDQIIKIIYNSLYDYLPDEMIDIVLKYSIVEDFNLYKWLQF